MSLLRDIKLSRLIGGEITPVETQFNRIFSDLNFIKCNVYEKNDSEYVFYNSEGKWMWYVESTMNRSWVHYDRFWKIFETDLGVYYDDVKLLLKFLFEEKINLKVNSPDRSWSNLKKLEEKDFKDLGDETNGVSPMSNKLEIHQNFISKIEKPSIRWV